MIYRLIKVVGEIGNSGEFTEFFRVHRYIDLEETPQRRTVIILDEKGNGNSESDVLFFVRDIATKPPNTNIGAQNHGQLTYLFSTKGISRYDYLNNPSDIEKLEAEYLKRGWNSVKEVDPCRIVQYEVW